MNGNNILWLFNILFPNVWSLFSKDYDLFAAKRWQVLSSGGEKIFLLEVREHKIIGKW